MIPSIVRNTGAAMGVLEAAHADAGTLSEWATRTVESSRALFALQQMTMSVVRREEDHYTEIVVAGSGITAHDRLEDVPLPVADCLFRLTQVARPVDIVRHMPEPFQLGWREHERRLGMKGGGGVMGYVGRVCFALYGWHPDPTGPIASEDRTLLRKVAAHIEAGLALRLGEATEIAVLRPDGRVEHAEGDLLEQYARDELTSHVREVESLRTRKRRSAPSALDAWTALLNGSWGLVERVDKDGQRFYVIVENTPAASRIRALTPHETSVLELSARGASGKSVAYALGISPAAVSQALSAAALKVGCRNRTQLVYSASLLLGPKRDDGVEQQLTRAERDVLALVRAGFTNAEIAVRRETSERTIANQVARLLKKASVPSRRALATWPKGR
jgi:DNA-binding NarL/FixJ family response regulator